MLTQIQAKQYAEAELARFIGVDMQDLVKQNELVMILEKIMRHFHRNDFYVVDDVYGDLVLCDKGFRFSQGDLILHWVPQKPRWTITPDGAVWFNGSKMF